MCQSAGVLTHVNSLFHTLYRRELTKAKEDKEALYLLIETARILLIKPIVVFSNSI